MSSGFYKQQGPRPACASAHSDQRLCYSRIGKNSIWTCYERNFIILASLCSQAGWFESHFIGNPEDRLSCDEAHLIVVFLSCGCQRPASLPGIDVF